MLSVWILGTHEKNLLNAFLTVVAGMLVGSLKPNSEYFASSVFLTHAMLGLLSVAFTATAAKLLGPLLTGLLFGYPVTFAAT